MSLPEQLVRNREALTARIIILKRRVFQVLTAWEEYFLAQRRCCVMPRAWPVEVHDCRYNAGPKQKAGGHGLGPWRFTFHS
jgi:hypothetical protein